MVSGPSGAGKGTLIKGALDRIPALAVAVSATTRAKRPGEVAGRDYHFIDPEAFGLMVNRGELLEHAKVFDNYYGTPKKPVEEQLAIGRDVLFDIDWQGTQQLRDAAREDLVSVFILPPSAPVLASRLRGRSKDSDEQIARRLDVSAREVSEFAVYDYVVINDEVDLAVDRLRAIVLAERSRVGQMRQVASEIVRTFHVPAEER